MSSHNWTDVWKLFLDQLSRESVAIQIGLGLGAAFIAVMALEGIRASFFPKRILEGVALRNITQAAAVDRSAPPAPEETRHAALWSPNPDQMVYALPQSMAVNDYPRRSSPQRLRIIGARKPV